MHKTKLSSKGQVIIPKGFRLALHWEPGQELIAYPMGDGVLLRPRTPFEETSLEEVGGCLPPPKRALSDSDINKQIKQRVRKVWRGSR